MGPLAWRQGKWTLFVEQGVGQLLGQKPRPPKWTHLGMPYPRLVMVMVHETIDMVTSYRHLVESMLANMYLCPGTPRVPQRHVAQTDSQHLRPYGLWYPESVNIRSSCIHMGCPISWSRPWLGLPHRCEVLVCYPSQRVATSNSNTYALLASLWTAMLCM